MPRATTANTILLYYRIQSHRYRCRSIYTEAKVLVKGSHSVVGEQRPSFGLESGFLTQQDGLSLSEAQPVGFKASKWSGAGRDISCRGFLGKGHRSKRPPTPSSFVSGSGDQSKERDSMVRMTMRTPLVEGTIQPWASSLLL